MNHGFGKYELSVILAGILWGSMGLFSRRLGSMGLESLDMITVRCLLSAFIFLLLAPTGRVRLRVRPGDFWCFFGSGIVSLLFFTYCYFQAISLMDLGTAAILLYTAPVIVMLLSAALFGERITGRKASALVLAVLGCAFVSGLGGNLRISPAGLLYGLGAGGGYALYSIFARFALKKGYGSSTINAWSCLLAGIGALLISGPERILAALTPGNFLFFLLASLVTCFLPYTLYTYGLSGMENGRASILASVEPVMAMLIGLFVFGEVPGPKASLGIMMVLAAIVLLNRGEVPRDVPEKR